MSNSTITVDGTELPANDIIEAVEDAGGPGEVSHRTGASGEVIVQYDYMRDDEAYLIYDDEHLQELRAEHRIAMNAVYEDAKDALGCDPDWLDDYSGFDAVEYLPDDGAASWNVMGVIEVNITHGSMLVSGCIPDEAEIDYVNNPAVAHEDKDYYGVDVPDGAVVFYLNDSRVE